MWDVKFEGSGVAEAEITFHINYVGCKDYLRISHRFFYFPSILTMWDVKFKLALGQQIASEPSILTMWDVKWVLQGELERGEFSSILTMWDVKARKNIKPGLFQIVLKSVSKRR